MPRADLAACFLQLILDIFDRFFFPANFAIQVDDQVGLHKYYHEGNVPLASIVSEIAMHT